jgi:hypothetical protein
MKRTTSVLCAGILLLAGAALAQSQKKNNKKQQPKVTLCHKTTGKNPGQKTIRVSESDVSSHLAHGDLQMACPKQ